MTEFERRLAWRVIASWTLLSVLMSAIRISMRLHAHSPVYVSGTLFFIYQWLIEGVAAAVLAIIAWRLRHYRHRFVLFAGATMMTFIVSVAIKFLSWLAVRPLLPAPPRPMTAARVLNSMLTLDMVQFFIVAVGTIAATVMIGAHRDGIAAETEAAQLEAALAEARLRNLRSQVKPALIHQSLAQIEASLPHDPIGAEATLLNLSDFLRLALLRASGHKLPSQMEAEYLRLEREVTSAAAI